MNFFWKKQRVIEEMAKSYVEETDACVKSFADSFTRYFASGIDGEFERLVEETHARESRADDKRRAIEEQLYRRALLPESRGDIMNVLEAFDRMPNKMESVLFQVLLEQLEIPPDYSADFRRLVDMNVEAYRLTASAFLSVFSDLKESMALSKKTDQKESESDRLERKLIRSVFSSNLEGSEKILIKDLILAIGDISDRAEDAADRISLVAAKSRL